jgi:hypothetical protein
MGCGLGPKVVERFFPGQCAIGTFPAGVRARQQHAPRGFLGVKEDAVHQIIHYVGSELPAHVND